MYESTVGSSIIAASLALLIRERRGDGLVDPPDGIGAFSCIIIITASRIGAHRATRLCDVTFAIDEIPWGGQYFLQHGRDWPEGSAERCAAADLILLGAVGWPDPKGGGPVTLPDGNMAGWSPVIGNRLHLDLYANVRPVRCLPGIRHGISGPLDTVWRPEQVSFHSLAAADEAHLGPVSC